MALSWKILFAVLLTFYACQGRRQMEIIGIQEILDKIEAGVIESSEDENHTLQSVDSSISLAHGSSSVGLHPPPRLHGDGVSLVDRPKIKREGLLFWLFVQQHYDYNVDKLKPDEYIVTGATTDESLKNEYLNSKEGFRNGSFTYGARTAVLCEWSRGDWGDEAVQLQSFRQDEIDAAMGTVASGAYTSKYPNVGKGYAEAMKRTLVPSSFKVIGTFPVNEEELDQATMQSLRRHTSSGPALQVSLSRGTAVLMSKNFRNIAKFISVTLTPQEQKDEKGCCRGFYGGPAGFLVHTSWVECFNKFIEATITHHWVPDGTVQSDEREPCVWKRRLTEEEMQRARERATAEYYFYNK